LSYKFTQKQIIHLEVFDADDSLPKDKKAHVDKNKHDLIVKVHFDLAVYMKDSMCKELVLKHKDNSSEVIVYIEEVRIARETYKLKFKASNLPERGFFKSIFSGNDRDYRIVVSKMAETGKFIRVLDIHLNQSAHESQLITVSSTKLCSGDPNRAIELTLVHVKSNGDEIKHAKFETTLMNLIESRKFTLDQTNVVLSEFESIVIPSFVDFLQ